MIVDAGTQKISSSATINSIAPFDFSNESIPRAWRIKRHINNNTVGLIGNSLPYYEEKNENEECILLSYLEELDKVSQSIIVVREQFWPASQRLLPYRRYFEESQNQSVKTNAKSLSQSCTTYTT